MAAEAAPTSAGAEPRSSGQDAHATAARADQPHCAASPNGVEGAKQQQEAALKPTSYCRWGRAAACTPRTCVGTHTRTHAHNAVYDRRTGASGWYYARHCGWPAFTRAVASPAPLPAQVLRPHCPLPRRGAPWSCRWAPLSQWRAAPQVCASLCACVRAHTAPRLHVQACKSCWQCEDRAVRGLTSAQ